MRLMVESNYPPFRRGSVGCWGVRVQVSSHSHFPVVLRSDYADGILDLTDFVIAGRRLERAKN
jgi:hypothetical protein